MDPKKNSSIPPKLKSCLKPPRNSTRVHPQNQHSTVLDSFKVKPTHEPHIPLNDEEHETNWSLYRTSFSNLSKRFRTKNKIGSGQDLNNNFESVQSLKSNRRLSRDPSIFSSSVELCSEAKEESGVIDKFLCKSFVPKIGNFNSDSGGFKRFLTITTIICISIVILIPSVFGGRDEGVGNRHLFKNIWKELSKEEIVSIFGRQHKTSHLDYVPNVDVIKPQVVRRERRSLDSSTAAIQIQGLGRHFNINVTQNRNLLDSHFVFLKRHDNHSEIMEDGIVNKQVPCFYQGVAEHYPVVEDDEDEVWKKENTIRGPVALSLCGGLKGFILPGDRMFSDHHNNDESNHHYVIHPIPHRFHHTITSKGEHNGLAKSTERKNASATTKHDSDPPLHERHHFLFKLTSSERQGHANSPKSVNNKDNSVCGHQKHENYAGHSSRKRRSPDIFDDPSHLHPPPQPRDLFDSYWFHQQQRYQPKGAMNSFRPSEPFTSSAVFPSSYWGPKSSELFGKRGGPGITGAANIGLTFARRNYYEVEDDNDRDSSSSNKDQERVLIYESTSSNEEPDTILPFYTKGRKKSKSRSSKGKPSWIINSSLENNNYTIPTPSWSTKLRKGRRDDVYFGPDWKSSLDGEDSSKILTKKRGRFDYDQQGENLLESNSIFFKEDKLPSQLTIETAVFVDKDLYKHMQSNFPEDTHGEVVRIVLAMINAVQLLYQDPSLGHRVDFVLKRLEVLETDPPGLLRPYDIDRFLTNFCKWQKTENPSSDADPLHWDHALILTGLDLYVVHQSGKISNQVVGLAPVAGMCTRSSSCTVNEGRHFESVFVIAHEIGHNLGMRHDGPQADNDCDPTSHIMSPTLGSGKISWSACSRKYLEIFLETPQSKCLLDKAKSESRLDHDADGRLPGERFDSDRQCVLKYGRGSFHATQQPLEDVCRDLHCRREHYTWTSHPALEGTYCGSDMWCRSGKCVRKSSKQSSSNYYNSPSNDDRRGLIASNQLSGGETAAYSVQKAVDGEWGSWSLFTDCSSACLYSDDGSLTLGSTGIRLAARRCDSPRPENGGRQCSGTDRRYKSCSSSKVAKICSGNLGRTTISHYANDVCSRASSVDNDLTGVGFMMSTNDDERACSVWCETLDNGVPRSRGWSFPDGTSCKVISQSKPQESYCVAGKCQDFTCNSYSHYALSDEECSFSASNEVTPQSSWYTTSKLDTESVGEFGPNLRNGKSTWTDWESHSDCKLPCLAPAKGLELVKRRCSKADDSSCLGLALSVRLCKPDKTAILKNGCTRLQTPFEYATKVCSKYASKISGLSGIGMQLSPTKEDIDRPCRVGCQDVSIPYRFYMVNGVDGEFPPGTDCSRGDPDKKAFCVSGKCVDFGSDDTPVYRVNTNLLGKIETLFQPRSKRQASYNILEPLKVPSSMDEASLRELVYKFSQQTGNFPSITTTRGNKNPLDFTRPIVTNNYLLDYSRKPYQKPSSIHRNSRPSLSDSKFYSRASEDLNDKQSSRGRSLDFETEDAKISLPTQGKRLSDNDSQNQLASLYIEGSYYEWRKIVSDCSVSCGKGMQEIIVECVSGDTVVSDRLCASRPRPGHSGYVDCHKTICFSARRSESGGHPGHLWNWLQSILPKNTRL